MTKVPGGADGNEAIEEIPVRAARPGQRSGVPNVGHLPQRVRVRTLIAAGSDAGRDHVEFHRTVAVNLPRAVAAAVAAEAIRREAAPIFSGRRLRRRARA